MNRSKAALVAATLFTAPSLALAAAHAGNPQVGGADMLVERNIIENAVNSPVHTTLVAAVQAAGLVETLQGDGPFTVFAPVDDAFAALPDGTVETLLMPGNRDMLVQVLTCHVVGTEAMSDTVATMIADGGGAASIDTLGGCTLTARLSGESITLTDENGTVANVTIADVKQSNGVIHVIDAVLTPVAAMDDDAMQDDMGSDMADDMADDMSGDTGMAMGDNPMVGGAEMFADRDIIDNAVNSPVHTTLVAAVQAAGLVDTLKSDGPFTVFAPTDAAFAALPDGTVDTLLQEENLATLQKVLTAHVVAGRLTAADLTAGLRPGQFRNLETVSGDALSVQQTPSGAIFVFDENGNAWRVSTADVMQSNGVIHVIDGVLLPR